MRLSHFTCRHAAPKIERAGVIRPFPHPFMPGIPPVAWFTDAPHLTAQEIGVQSEALLDCNRMEYEFVVETVEQPFAYMRWADFADRACLNPATRFDLEVGRKHDTWWVALAPVTWIEVGVLA